MVMINEGMTVADRYLLNKSLGKGGMGEVFLATDQTNNKEVALKTLHAHYATNNAARARFVREVNTMHKLHHPGIVKVFDAFLWEDNLFYVMEYVNGKSLRRWLGQRGKLKVATVVRVLSLICDALSHAHHLTIHRDLSPENIMVLKDGSIRILDFGLAKIEDKFKDLTMIGVNLGKLAYMAPEQQVNAATVDHRADIYPLGVMFFELLVGRRPEPGQRITDFCPELPMEANDFLDRAMAPTPEKRFPSVRSFRSELLILYQRYTGHIPSTPALVPAPQVKVEKSSPSFWNYLSFWKFFSRSKLKVQP
ncbi:MAG: serine/threonine-protein kinase [Candidatus Hydrogenedentales bacterium]|jgi:serine/threonine protein kinase